MIPRSHAMAKEHIPTGRQNSRRQTQKASHWGPVRSVRPIGPCGSWDSTWDGSSRSCLWSNFGIVHLELGDLAANCGQSDASYLRHYRLRSSTLLVLDLQTRRCGFSTEDSYRSSQDATLSWWYRYFLWVRSSIHVHLRPCCHSFQGLCCSSDRLSIAWTSGALCTSEQVRSGPVQGRSAEIRKP